MSNARMNFIFICALVASSFLGNTIASLISDDEWKDKYAQLEERVNVLETSHKCALSSLQRCFGRVIKLEESEVGE